MASNIKLLLDVGAIKTGGGIQLALNFLPPFLERAQALQWQVTLLLPSEGPLREFRHQACDSYLASPGSALARFYFEHCKLPGALRHLNINVIFTFMGFGLPRPPQVAALVNMANATTCYPDSLYWRYQRPWAKVKKQLYNRLRLERLRKASAIVVETRIMQEHLCRAIDLPLARTQVLAPSPSQYVPDSPCKPYAKSAGLKILLLSGLDFHKNLWRLPQICTELKRQGAQGIQFVASFSREAFAKACGLAAHTGPQDFDAFIDFRGKIASEAIGQLYQACNLVMCISELESFSNNYMEAWKAGMALVCSDRDFAHHICGRSAIYVEPHQPEALARQLIALSQDSTRLAAAAQAGKQLLAQLPSLDARIDQYMQWLEALAKEPRAG